MVTPLGSVRPNIQSRVHLVERAFEQNLPIPPQRLIAAAAEAITPRRSWPPLASLTRSSRGGRPTLREKGPGCRLAKKRTCMRMQIY